MLPVQKFGKVCDFVRGPFGGSLKKNCFVDDGYAVYEQQHAIYDQFSEIRYFIDEKKFSEMKRFALKPGDLIMSCSGTMGKVAIVPDDIKPGIINQALLKLSAKEHLDVEFLKYWMNSPDFIARIEENTVGAAIKNVASVKVLKEIDVPLPSLQEQQQIVSILDDAFEAINQAKANIEKNIANAKELFQSKLNAIFSQKGEGWEEKSLGGMSKIMYGCTAKVVENGNVQYLRITDIQEGEVNWDYVPYISISEEDTVKYGLIIGDIVFARTGATTGKSYLITEDNLNAVFASYLIRVQIDKIVLRPAFLSLFFQSGIYWKIVNHGISGSAQGGFNASKLGDMVIHFPIDQNAQNRIVEEMETFKKNLSIVIDNLNRKLKSLDELKNSILQKAFSGELTNKSLVN